MTLTDDPLVDAARHEAEQERRLARLPICECCGEPIQQEKAVCFAGKWWCSDCEREFYQYIRQNFLANVQED